MNRIVLFTVAIVLAVIACDRNTARSGEPADTPAAKDSDSLTSLAESLTPLRDHFNANKNKYRFVTLLSPT